MDVRIGARYRALRYRLGWRQADLARRAGMSPGVVSLIERGRLDRVSLPRLRRVAAQLDAELLVQLRWRGGDLDRLVDEGHATLAGAVARLLAALAWVVQPEVTYAVYGERGSIDLLAWHPATRTLLVVEVKTELTSIEEVLRKHGEKARLAARIAQEQFGWRAATVARLLVLPDLSTPRRRVERHGPVLHPAYPMRGPELRRWLGSPGGASNGLLFVRPQGSRSKRAIARKRIRCSEPAN